MSDDRILNKIKRCLALSKSANENEAAIALRQAHALMEKHQLDLDDVEASEINIVEVATRFSRHPNWVLLLNTVIAEAFECSAYHAHKRITFVGSGPRAELCAYAFETLMRVLESSKKEFLKSMVNKLGGVSIPRGAKTKMGKGYAEGWIAGVYKGVSEFAGKTDEEERQRREDSHTSALSKKTERPIGAARKKKSALNDDIGMLAASQGVNDGGKVSLYSAVGKDAESLRLEGGCV